MSTLDQPPTEAVGQEQGCPRPLAGDAAEPTSCGVGRDENPRPGPHRSRLPDTRQSITHKFCIAGHEGYITVGLYPDGLPGELFVTMAKEGSTIGGLMDTVGLLTSLALQYGVPVERLAFKFRHTRFEPSGHTTNPEIQVASSISDYIFTWLGLTFSEEFRREYQSKAAQRESV